MFSSPTKCSGPDRHLSCCDAVLTVLGIVIGSGVFVTPALVAANTATIPRMFLAWALGGFLCLCGALSYAELGAAFPHAGGEYVYLSTAFGRTVGFFFIWARVTVIQTGAIAATAYIFGHYVAEIYPMGPFAPVFLALIATIGLTGVNAVGLKATRWTQNVLTTAKILGITAIVVVGLVLVDAPPESNGIDSTTAPVATGSFGLAMVFVLYTFGGWNEASYVAGDVRHPARQMRRILVISVLSLTALYIAVNLAYLRILGTEGMSDSMAVAAHALERVTGRPGNIAVSTLVAVSALGAVNGCIFTGARAMWAAGGDFTAFRHWASWHPRLATPLHALLLQGTIAVILILLPAAGGRLRELLGLGFETAIEYTAPAFWIFMLLTSIAPVLLRWRNPTLERPFRIPLYPFPSILLAAMSTYMLYCSLAYTRLGALVGVGVLIAGIPIYWYSECTWRQQSRTDSEAAVAPPGSGHS